MLDHFKQSLTKLFATCNERIDIARVRGSLERLEDRTMLSASYGMMAYNYDGPNSGPHGGAGSQKFSDSAAFASQQPRSQAVSYNSPSFTGVRESGYAYRDYQSHLAMQSAFPPPQQISGDGQRWLPEPGWNQFMAGPPRYGAYSVTYYYFEYVPPSVHDQQPLNIADPDNFVPPRALGLKTPPNGSGGLAGDIADLGRIITQNNRIQPPAAPDFVGKLNGTALPLNSVLASVVSTTSAPIASQILSRETTTVAALNAVARDVAFQEFSLNLFQSNTTTAYDRVNVDTLGGDTIQSEIIDGMIHPAKESTSDVIANSSDAVEREREAVDAVLEDLHDVDSLLPATESQDLNFKIDLQTETALDELPAGEVDGGMVLLKSTGDANGSGFDLTQVYADHVERFSAPAKMETSVGMFQAIDVASDEPPTVEAVPQTDSTTPLNRETKLEDKLPSKREQSPSNKAAAIVGVTTLTGALVWLNRSGSRFSRPKATAQKRRAARS